MGWITEDDIRTAIRQAPGRAFAWWEHALAFAAFLVLAVLL